MWLYDAVLTKFLGRVFKLQKGTYLSPHLPTWNVDVVSSHLGPGEGTPKVAEQEDRRRQVLLLLVPATPTSQSLYYKPPIVYMEISLHHSFKTLQQGTSLVVQWPRLCSQCREPGFDP